MNAALSYLAVINTLSFLAFGWDKRAARLGNPRVPEARLLWLAVLGGWPGAWVAASVFRHKTLKRSFRMRLVLVTLLDIAVVGAATWWWLGVRATG